MSSEHLSGIVYEQSGACVCCAPQRNGYTIRLMVVFAMCEDWMLVCVYCLLQVHEWSNGDSSKTKQKCWSSWWENEFFLGYWSRPLQRIIMMSRLATISLVEEKKLSERYNIRNKYSKFNMMFASSTKL